MFEDTETVNEPSETTNMDSAQFFLAMSYIQSLENNIPLSLLGMWFVECQ